MHFLRRNPVPPKQIDEQKLMIDLTDYARKDKRSKIISGIVFFVCTIIMIILKGYYEINILIFFGDSRSYNFNIDYHSNYNVYYKKPSE